MSPYPIKNDLRHLLTDARSRAFDSRLRDKYFLHYFVDFFFSLCVFSETRFR
jgi:hypothetical protein